MRRPVGTSLLPPWSVNAWRWIAGANVNLSLASCGDYKMSVGRGSAAPVGAASQLPAESKGQMETSLGE